VSVLRPAMIGLLMQRDRAMLTFLDVPFGRRQHRADARAEPADMGQVEQRQPLDQVFGHRLVVGEPCDGCPEISFSPGAASTCRWRS
jgi:hypothetical protein